MKISNQKKEKISEQILAFLYSISPRAVFTYNIAQETARDEEFIKGLLFKLKEKNLIIEVKKSPKGNPYTRRSRWKLSDVAFLSYQTKQSNFS